MLCGIENECCAWAEKGRASAGDDGAVLQFHGGAGHSGLFLAFACKDGGTPVRCVNLGLLEEEGNLVHLVVVSVSVGQAVQGCIVASDNFVLRGIATHLLIADAEANHVHSHIRGRLVGVLAVDAFEKGVQHGENFRVAVVADSNSSVCFKVEGVDDVDVVQVGRGGFVSNVDGMFERKVPHGEGLKLGISGLNAPPVLVIELAQTHRHLSASGAGRCDDYKRTCGLHIVIASETLFAVYERHVVGIAFDGVVQENLHAQALKALSVVVGRTLSVIVGDDNAAHHEPFVDEFRAQTQNVHVVCDAEVLSHLVLLNVQGGDDDYDFGLVLQLHEHAQLAVGLEAGKHTAGVVVVEELAAQLQIELVAELRNAFPDMFRLYVYILVVVKSNFHLSV